MASVVTRPDFLQQQLFFLPYVLNNEKLYEVSGVLWDTPQLSSAECETVTTVGGENQNHLSAWEKAVERGWKGQKASVGVWRELWLVTSQMSLSCGLFLIVWWVFPPLHIFILVLSEEVTMEK